MVKARRFNCWNIIVLALIAAGTLCFLIYETNNQTVKHVYQWPAPEYASAEKVVAAEKALQAAVEEAARARYPDRY